MALTTLADMRAHLGITGTDEDTQLTRWIREISSLVRARSQSWLYGLISAASVANPTVVTMIGHGLQTGDTVVISGSNSTPTIDGERVVTVLSPDTFSVPVTVTVAGTAGVVAKKITEYYSGDGTQFLSLRQRPVQSVASLYLDAGGYFGRGQNAFAADTAMTEGQDFVLRLDAWSSADSESGIVERIGAVWPGGSSRSHGMLASSPSPGQGNIKVVYTTGYRVVPYDLQLAMHRAIADVRMTQESSGGMQSESLDYYSYARLSAAEEAAAMTSLTGLLKRFKRWVL